ncbi:MAG: acetyl-CoA carboxylase biotin carboxylase subunit, partial [Terriglobales bacterium]
ATHLAAAQSESAAAFGCGDIYLEKYVVRPRHIEFQVLADEHGRVMHLGERECTLQRRHQKLLEESPSVRMTPELRQRMGGLVIRALQTAGYTNAGTVEFLMDEDGSLYFIEMNTRLQVEHPVTEMVTGVDLVKAQIHIADGASLEAALGFDPAKLIFPRGHAIECRINAENPDTFAPSAGRITAFHAPGGNGVRLDSAAYSEGQVPPYYDSLIAKVIAHGRDREEARRRMIRALEMFVVQGVDTSIPLHLRILQDPDFRAGNFDTRFMDRFQPVKKPGHAPPAADSVSPRASERGA